MSHEIEIDRNKHAVSILDRMEEMMREESRCDFTIKVGSEEIKTHSLVLTSASNYFQSMLKSDMKESQSDSVTMADIDFKCMKICLDFIYNKKVTIPVEKYEDLLYLANMLQLKEFCDYIYAKLDKELDSQLFFATKRIADMYGHKKLEEKCVKFAEENFASISKEDGFRDLGMEYVHKMISSKNVKVTEEEKLDVVLRFVKVEKKRRKQFAEMIEWVDLGKVSLERREGIMENEPLVCDNLKVYRVFTASLKNTFKQQLETFEGDEASKAKETSGIEVDVTGLHEMQSPGSSVTSKPGSTVQQDAGSRMQQTSGLQVAQNYGSARRQNVSSSWSRTVSSSGSARQLGAARHESNIVLFDQASEHLLRFNPKNNTVTQMKEMFDEMNDDVYSAVAVDDYVCVLKEQKFHRFKYSDATSPWEQMPDMICEHGWRPPVTATMGCMYVCGGSISTGTTAFEKFDLRERKWKRLKDKPRASIHSAMLVSNGNVYSFGGMVRSVVTNRVERFNIASSTWAEVAPMKYAKSVAAAVEANRSIFVLGGWDGKAALDKVERYCVSSNQWTEIKPMKIARHWFKAFAIDGTIYAVGGWNADVAREGIEKYQVARDEWEVVELSSAGRKLMIWDSVEIKI